ncbi:MAG: hypothetical protein GWM92_20285 [Gemmatimonadetes bacterium]|nr:hypothetical protein [Gemmatimonadota bacterium]NIR81161.1 hypothetical protein [Gemmatimonadota bacterium]NIT89992.1 hypothetical protein [Gemmatimonadota bacterium]NIU33799.1 hypothetical protein [Gemmatimonadota bacterium]NIU34347.1 hypothetical protein [Gemmatimonadota bacterium]
MSLRLAPAGALRGALVPAGVLVGALALVLAPAAAQEPPPETPAPDPADVESVDAIVAAVYDVISGSAGEARDWDRFRSLFAPGARLIPIGRESPEGAWRGFRWGVENYIERASSSFEENDFFEREIHRVTERYGTLIHAWSTYESRRAAADPEPFARGINSFQLLDDGSRLWVVSIFWASEGPGRPIPERYLPGGP